MFLTFIHFYDMSKLSANKCVYLSLSILSNHNFTIFLYTFRKIYLTNIQCETNVDLSFTKQQLVRTGSKCNVFIYTQKQALKLLPDWFRH